MTSRTTVLLAIASTAALWLTRITGVATARRTADVAKRGAGAALVAEGSLPLASPSKCICFDAHRLRVTSGNGAYGKQGLTASPERPKEGERRSILKLAGSVKSAISGVSIEDMKSWRQGPSLARLLRLAQHVWSDSRDAAAWMSNAQIALGGKTPIQAVMTDSGAERVEAILWRRIHGATT